MKNSRLIEYLISNLSSQKSNPILPDENVCRIYRLVKNSDHPDRFVIVDHKNRPCASFKCVNGSTPETFIKRYKYSCQTDRPEMMGPNIEMKDVNHGVSCHACEGKEDFTTLRQYQINTGRCWWTSLWTVMAYPIQMESLFYPLFLHAFPDYSMEWNTLFTGTKEDDLSSSEKIRSLLHKEWNVGDSPDTPPEKEGKNAMVELETICKNLGVTISRKDTTLFHDSSTKVVTIWANKFGWIPISTFLSSSNGKTYSVQGGFLGHGEAGHQIGVAVCNNDPYELIVGDSDANLMGIQSHRLHLPRDSDWGKSLSENMTILNEKHSFSLNNISSACVKGGEHCDTDGRLECTWVYLMQE